MQTLPLITPHIILGRSPVDTSICDIYSFHHLFTFCFFQSFVSSQLVCQLYSHIVNAVVVHLASCHDVTVLRFVPFFDHHHLRPRPVLATAPLIHHDQHRLSPTTPLRWRPRSDGSTRTIARTASFSPFRPLSTASSPSTLLCLGHLYQSWTRYYNRLHHFYCHRAGTFEFCQGVLTI